MFDRRRERGELSEKEFKEYLEKQKLLGRDGNYGGMGGEGSHRMRGHGQEDDFDKTFVKDGQRIPKVARNLPHIRQPEHRDRDVAGCFTSFVARQYLPQFFRYI